MRMLKIDEVAARLGVCRRTAEAMLAEGRLPKPVRFGRLRRWSDEQIDQLIVAEVARAGGSVAPAAPERRRGPGRPRSE
jgi:excisionase family DNA binding protein